MRLVYIDAEIGKREAELHKYEERIKGYVVENEPDNIRIISRINQCKANMHDIKTEIQILKNLPVAYDVEKVIENVKKLYDCDSCNAPGRYECSLGYCIAAEVIDVVKNRNVNYGSISD